MALIVVIGYQATVVLGLLWRSRFIVHVSIQFASTKVDNQIPQSFSRLDSSSSVCNPPHKLHFSFPCHPSISSLFFFFSHAKVQNPR